MTTEEFEMTQTIQKLEILIADKDREIEELKSKIIKVCK